MKAEAWKILGYPANVLATCFSAAKDILQPLEELNQMILLVLIIALIGFALIPTPAGTYCFAGVIGPFVLILTIKSIRKAKR